MRCSICDYDDHLRVGILEAYSPDNKVNVHTGVCSDCQASVYDANSEFDNNNKEEDERELYEEGTVGAALTLR